MEEALRHSTDPCGGGSGRRVPDIRWNPSCGGTGSEDPERWGRATQGMADGHSHLDRWAASVGRDARSILEGVDYDTVTSYCFQKSWQD